MSETDHMPDPIPSCGRCILADEVAQLRREVATLAELVRTDPLTGIPNLRYFYQALEQEMERTCRSGKPTCLVMLDIDHFKRVNDTWGHENGNRALVHVTRIMQDSLRRIDIPCRYGGEEFAIILAHTDLPAAIRVAERLRRNIAATPLVLEQGELILTASLGIEVYQEGQRTAPEALVHQADQFLYQAKQEGRNRVCHPPLPSADTSGSVGQEEKAALFGLFGGEPAKTVRGRKGTRSKNKPGPLDDTTNGV